MDNVIEVIVGKLLSPQFLDPRTVFNVSFTSSTWLRRVEVLLLDLLKTDFGVVWTKDTSTTILRTFQTTWSRRKLTTSLGTVDSVLCWEFHPWNYNGPNNGFFVRTPEGSKLTSLWLHNTARWWCEKYAEGEGVAWMPPDHEALSTQFMSGHHVPFTNLLLQYLQAIVPPSPYMLSSWQSVPTLQTSYRQLRDSLRADIERLFSVTVGDYGDECVFPKHIGVYCRNGWQGDEGCGSPYGLSWFFEDLRVVAIPLHPVWDEERISFYEKKMITARRNGTEYSPTCLLLCPHYYPSVSIGGIVLDGHHKLAAATRQKHPLRIILVEMRYEGDAEEPALPYLHPTEEQIEYFRNQMFGGILQ
eukprot:TRINITY_DN2526_c0_g2_i1.p1 TRINITY_DN2526_c0_g2~~TRINITY_DN2526_c0_g2_i1.p1  ORF type:complete len:359 (-),score=27.88 TRINITY_DN2526_c0_g2_i1:177-1253(-)